MTYTFITGAGREDGIGYQVVARLAEIGHVVLAAVRDQERAAPLFERFGKSVSIIPLDISSEVSLTDLRLRVEKVTPVVDVIINNAGLLLDGNESILQTARSTFERTFAVNTVGPARIVQELLPLLKRSSSPRIINVSSGAGQLSDGELSTWAPAYSSSKAALNALTQQLAAALPGTAVNSVCPGWCRTQMGGSGATRSAAEGADTIIWLATEAPQALTGNFLRDRKEIAW